MLFGFRPLSLTTLGFKKNQKNQRPYHVVTGDEMTCVMVDVRWLLIVCVCVLKSDYGIYQFVYLITARTYLYDVFVKSD